jgi:hypothetical protein
VEVRRIVLHADALQPECRAEPLIHLVLKATAETAQPADKDGPFHGDDLVEADRRCYAKACKAVLGVTRLDKEVGGQRVLPDDTRNRGHDYIRAYQAGGEDHRRADLPSGEVRKRKVGEDHRPAFEGTATHRGSPSASV